MFGSNDGPDDNDEGAGEFQGHDIGDAVNAVLRPKARPHQRRTESAADGDGGAAWRLKFWQRQHGGVENAVVNPISESGGAADGGRHIRSQTSFRHFFNRNKKSGVDLEATLDAELADLEGGGVGVGGGGGGASHARAATTVTNSNSRPFPSLPARPGRSPVRPQAFPAGSPDGSVVVDLGDVKGGKLKAAVKRAMAASRREKEAAARRGRQRQRQEQELGEFQGFIQVKDPALNKVCVEYGLTADLAETKYR